LELSEGVIYGRDTKTTMTIMDSKGVKNTEAAGAKGYDAGKKFTSALIPRACLMRFG
jgi:hypothetical protein